MIIDKQSGEGRGRGEIQSARTMCALLWCWSDATDRNCVSSEGVCLGTGHVRRRVYV